MIEGNEAALLSPPNCSNVLQVLQAAQVRFWGAFNALGPALASGRRRLTELAFPCASMSRSEC